MELKILTFPNPRLRIKAKEIKFLDPEIKSNLTKLFDLMYEKDGIGLAATQVGIHQRFFVYDLSEEKNSPKIAINPRIIWKSPEKIIYNEGCLSIPGLRLNVERSKKIKVVWIDENGLEQQKEVEDLESVLFQHEIDHLDGKLIIDKLPKEERKKIIELLY
ncbi:MAG: peptide deformylase [Candidatus Calescibacterium sp.]|nr:peptide deformylase [Candidatus Calescibacterium sp.]MCX7734182.1 peptide deformylase [bacterium]MDW8086556.1 peptide deformylase [Candidatus Calescibacterium sp.]